MPRRPRRETYFDDRLLLPALRMIGWNSARAALDTRLPGHVHSDAFEICYIARGSVEWWVGRRTYEVGPGEVYVTRPGEMHGGVDAVIQPCDLYWILVAPEPAFARRLSRLRLRHFDATSAVKRCCDALLQEHRRRDSLSSTAASAALNELLVTVLRDHARALRERRAADDRLSPPIREAMAWMAARLEEDYAIADAADVAGLSVTQFHERFRREVGHTPAGWRTRERVRRAKGLLRGSSLSVTDVAMRTGFATSQYFATVFKNMVGLTPGDYRARAGG